MQFASVESISILTAVFPRSALARGHARGLHSQQQRSASHNRIIPSGKCLRTTGKMQIGMAEFNC